MKTKIVLARIIFTLSLTALLGASQTASAQPSPNEKQKNNRPAQRGDRPQGGFQPGGFQGQFFPILQRVLTDEQRTSLREVMEAERENMRGVEEKLRDARKELLKASVIEKFDEDAVRKKALEVGKLDAELTVLRAKAFAKMKPVLSAEQIEQIKNPPPFEGGPNRGENPGEGRGPSRFSKGPRDENDLPVPPKAEK